MAPDQTVKATKLGEYEVLVADAAVAFWPLNPEVDLSCASPSLVCAPGTNQSVNTAVIATFGIFDIVVRLTEDVVSEEIEAPDLPDAVSGTATIKKSPLIAAGDGTAHIRVGVNHAAVAAGGSWEGKLRLTAPYKSGTTTKTCTLEVKLKQAKQATTKDLLVFFVVHAKPKKAYAWVKASVVDAEGAPVTGADVDLKVLRDNLAGNGYAGRNRRVALTTDEGGHASWNDERNLLAVPVEWPLIFTIASGKHVTRAHMIRLKESVAAQDNQTPTAVGPVRLITTAGASLAGKKFLLDAGHGVVYGLATARRSQEWFVAHKLADRVAAILTSEHGVSDDDILWTRTAGFGLIEPGQVNQNGAPETGDARYKVDLPTKRAAIKLGTLGLHNLSTFLLTRHQGDANTVVALTEAERNALLTRNAATMTAIVTRINGTLAAKKERVQPGSPAWHQATGRYIYVKEKQGTDGAWAVVDAATPLPINTTDWFALDTQALEALADRAARWSLTCEIGTGPAAAGGRPAFAVAARAAMRAAGALDYMRAKTLRYLNVTAPHPYLDHGPKAWGPTHRLAFFNNEGAASDLVLTLHENAGGGKGGMVLVSHKTGADKPPKDQVRIGKVFLKYLDGFDQGLRQGGVTTNLPANPAGMLYAANTMREKFAYFETEFMDAVDPNDSTKYTYQSMVGAAFIDRVARQIVCGVVEWLLEPQSDLDDVYYNATKIEGLW